MEKHLTVTIDATMIAPWYKRLLNLVIDTIVVLFIFLILTIVGLILDFAGYSPLLEWLVNMDGLTDRFVTTAVMVIYLFIIENFTQRSVGKFITGTIVVSADGSKPEPRMFFIRAICRAFWLEVFSFIRAFPRGWHDSAANTYVVDRKKYMNALNLKDSFEQIGVEQ